MQQQQQQHKCGYRFCRREIPANQSFCSGSHRYKEWDLRHPRADIDHRRRPSRDGKGTRIYVNPEEQHQLLAGTIPATVITKLDRS